MRRKERRHLKENPLVSVFSYVQETLNERSRSLFILVAVCLLGLFIGVGYVWWQQQNSDQAGTLLADAMMLKVAEVVAPTEQLAEDEDNRLIEEGEQPLNSFPSEKARLETSVESFLFAANAYPATPQAVIARFEAAAALVRLGRLEEASEQYEQVIELDRDQFYGRMARLGLADASLVAGDYSRAINLLEIETGMVDFLIPIDSILMRLGRAYKLDNKESEALAAYSRIVEEFPFSIHHANAQRETEALRGRVISPSGG